MTALIIAAQCGYLDIVELLADKEGCLRDGDGKNALMHAAAYNCTECIRPLRIEAGMQDNEGTTAMIIAARNKCFDVSELLFPFEAGMVDDYRRNQTRGANGCAGTLVQAIRLEKTAGWLFDGKTVLEGDLCMSSLSEEN